MSSDVSLAPDAKESQKLSKRRPHKYLIALGVFSLLALIGVLSIIAFAFIEGKRAERDWDDFRAHWEAKGEIFEMDKLISIEIPSEENFAVVPIIAELFDKQVSARLSQVNPDFITGIKKPTAAFPISRIALNAPRKHLSAFLLNSESYPSNEESARAILKNLEPLSPLIDELKEASRLPAAKFPMKYKYSVAMKFDHLSPITQTAKILSLRSRSHLTLGNSDSATSDLLTLLRIAHLTGSEPSLVSHSTEINLIQLTLAMIWQGLNDHHFHATDLKKLDHALLNLELRPRIAKALRSERAAFIAFINSSAKIDRNPTDDSSDARNVSSTLSLLGFSKAFWIRNKLSYSSFIQDHGLRTGNEVNVSNLNLSSIQNFDEDAMNLHQHPVLAKNPYTVMALMAMPASGVMVKKSTRTSSRIDLCRIAIALELYHIEHSSYPATLAALSPAHIATLPHDLISGAPLNYRIKTDDTFIIYSVGLNNTDEGGLLKRDRNLGDWAWQYTLPENFDEAIWRN